MSRPAPYGSFRCHYCREAADKLVTIEGLSDVWTAACGRCRPERARSLPRIGPRMIDAVRYIAVRPGNSKAEIARMVGPHGSIRYGWEIVQRCIGAGLVRDAGTPARAALHATYLGRCLVTR